MSYKTDSRNYAVDEGYPDESDLQLDASELPTDRASTRGRNLSVIYK